ncbi:general stress protein [Paenibacillus sp. CAA11]|uniref:pyridoxamine 5'-phosphate oxidase family protein n=1 Tax=Paenibacillus sp. CAA11 TaxID=1532905 RepID=UPI000D3D3834|nr:pyridoxamine 5'-phosphate oxidase family protein [Paenibacillus sp. CAA11]AWB43203.1 general stress protein [Paenibacillus sp. CAA11]
MANTLESKIGRALEENKFAAFATVEGGKPKVRYMALYHDGLEIYMATDKKTHKVQELEQNSNVFLLLGYEKGGTGDVLEIEGTAKISDNEELKKSVWRDEFSRWLDGPNDPDYVVLKITPSRIEVLNEGGENEVWTA